MSKKQLSITIDEEIFKKIEEINKSEYLGLSKTSNIIEKILKKYFKIK